MEVKDAVIKQPLTDLKAQYKNIKPEIDTAIQNVLDRCDFILGTEVKQFEQEVAEYIGVKHAIGVASGTDALKIALMSIGVGKGDEVITTPFTFIATVEIICETGAKPVFADIDPETLNINPDEIKKKISDKTKAVIPVHLYGLPVELDDIASVVNGKDIAIIEDCAQAFGAVYKNKKVGSVSAAGCFSFFPGKNLGCYGDGGIITTNNDDIARLSRLIRNHGSKNKYEHITPGFNSRLDTIQAAILKVKLRYIDQWNKSRRDHARFYQEHLGALGYTFPKANSYSHSSMNYFTLFVDRNRDGLKKHLNESSIATAVYYPVSLHVQEVFKFLGYEQGDMPMAEKMQDTILSLPLYPELTKIKLHNIVDAIKKYIKI